MGYRSGRSTSRAPGNEYDLGIDLGTTYTAAAVRTVGETTARVVRLERGADQIPSVLLVDEDGALRVGGEAERAAPSSPERVVREFKRRLGDDTPLVVGGTAFSADGVAAETIRWAADEVAELEGHRPRRIAVSHPAGWGAYRRRLFADALCQVGLPDVVLITEPEAAALAHGSTGQIPDGHTVAVYDLGGGTFDAAVVRGRPEDEAESGSGVSVLGQAQGLEALGGVDFDEALFWHVCAELGGAVAALDPDDPATRRAVAGLRRACVATKEHLSLDTEAVVEVDLPGTRTRVRVTRTEFEEMIEPALWQTVDVLHEVLDQILVGGDELDGVMMVGGSSRIPLVARVLAREFGCPVSIDADPTSVVARGAALAAERGSGTDHLLPRPIVAVPRRRPGAREGAGRSRVRAEAVAGTDSASSPFPAETGTDVVAEPAGTTAVGVAGPELRDAPPRPVVSRSRPTGGGRHAAPEPDEDEYATRRPGDRPGPAAADTTTTTHRAVDAPLDDDRDRDRDRDDRSGRRYRRRFDDGEDDLPEDDRPDDRDRDDRDGDDRRPARGPARPPLRGEAEPDEADDPRVAAAPRGSRRTIALAVGGGVLVGAVIVFAATVPVVPSGSSSPAPVLPRPGISAPASAPAAAPNGAAPAGSAAPTPGSGG